MWKKLPLFCAVALCTGLVAGQEQEEASDGVNVEDGLDDIWRYENFVLRDHQYMVGQDINVENEFKHYRYDGFVGSILTNAAYTRRHYKDCPKLVPLYQAYHGPNTHHYLTFNRKIVTNYGDGLPIGWCSTEPGYCGATEALHSYTGQPINYLGHRGYDTFATTDQKEINLPDKTYYQYDGVLCYIWKRPESRNRGDMPRQNINIELRHLFKHLTPIYQFFDKINRNHFLNTTVSHPNMFQYTLAYLIKPESYNIFKGICTDLWPIFDYRRMDWISDETEMAVQFLNERKDVLYHNKRLLGYASPRKDFCGARMVLNKELHMRGDHGALNERVLDNDMILRPDQVPVAEQDWKEHWFIW